MKFQDGYDMLKNKDKVSDLLDVAKDFIDWLRDMEKKHGVDSVASFLEAINNQNKSKENTNG